MNQCWAEFEERPGIRRKGPPITLDRVQAFERTLGFRLPADYRQFLLVLNGVDFQECAPGQQLCFPVRERWADEHRHMPHLIPPFAWPPEGEVFSDLIEFPADLLGLDSQESLSAENSYYGFGQVMPRPWLVIGFTRVNDIICLSCDDVKNRGVYYWNTVAGSYGTTDDALEGLSRAAESFPQFRNDLYPSASKIWSVDSQLGHDRKNLRLGRSVRWQPPTNKRSWRHVSGPVTSSGEQSTD